MDYQQTLDYMYSQLPMYQRQGAVAMKKTLGNIIALMDGMGNPHQRFKSIHVAGTNGKGTTAHIIAAGLQANGLNVGMYTSPHYIDFRERIKINGQFISQDHVIKFVEQYRDLFEKIGPSFFEMTVAMAFHYFAEQGVDVAVIEVGLGGRLDSTNIITPLLSIITNVSYDHQAMLGDTLEEIAWEKGGIIKEGVPVVIGEDQKELQEVVLKKQAVMDFDYHLADMFTLLTENEEGSLSIEINHQPWIQKLHTNLRSDVQQKNLITALYSLHHLKDYFQLKTELIAQGIQNMDKLTYYIGRYQQLMLSPLVLADSAHNIAGVQELLLHIEKINYQKLHIVIGMVNDKDIGKVLNLLPESSTYYFVKADIPRGLPTDKLMAEANIFHLIGKCYNTVKDGYETAVSNAHEEDLVLVMGSIFVVAEVLALHKQSTLLSQ